MRWWSLLLLLLGPDCLRPRFPGANQSWAEGGPGSQQHPDASWTHDHLASCSRWSLIMSRVEGVSCTRVAAMLIYLEQTNPFIQIFGQIHVDPLIRYICMRAFGEISRGLRSMFATLKRCQVMSDALDTPAKRFQQHARHYCALERLQ